MKEKILRSRNSITEIIRDDHDESGKYYFHQTIYDDHILERNKRLRLEDMMVQGQRVPALGNGDSAEIGFAFSIPQEHFAILQRDNPELFAGLTSKDPEENLKAARRLQILHPEWSVLAGNR